EGDAVHRQDEVLFGEAELTDFEVGGDSNGDAGSGFVPAAADNEREKIGTVFHGRKVKCADGSVGDGAGTKALRVERAGSNIVEGRAVRVGQIEQKYLVGDRVG